MSFRLFKVTELLSLRRLGKLDHGEYHHDEDDDNVEDDGLGNGENDGEGHNHDDGDDGIRWREGEQEELQNESDSLHRSPGPLMAE